MSFLNLVPAAPGLRRALALACGVVASVPAWGVDELEPVVVTGSRMPQLLKTAPIGASVITAEQIERSGAVDANEAIRKLGGVVSTMTDLNGGREYALDLRGYGDTAAQNMVVLVDGIRISENELASARLSAIPLALIDRIEIVRGGNSVLWGEGASSGVINVILKRPEGEVRQGRIGAALESFRGHEVTASGQWGAGRWAFDASAKRLRSAGFRDNGHYKQDVKSAGMRWTDGGWRAGLRIQTEDQKAGMPGAISYAQYRQDRRAASNPSAHADVRETRYLADMSYARGPWAIQVDAGQRERLVEWLAPGSRSPRSSTQHQLSPRLSYSQNRDATRVSGIVGLDWQGWYMHPSFPPDAYQDNRAAYAQMDVALPSLTRVSAGWRQERAHRLTGTFERDEKLHAWELGLNQTIVPGVDLYGRLASSFRLPNVDEYTFTLATAPLQPQRNRDKEFGLKLSQGALALTVRHFEQQSVNEIAYDPTQGGPFGANVNLDPTRRKGTELEARLSVSDGLTVSGTLQQLTAKFRQGVYAGNEMPLVSPRSATLRLAYRIDPRQTIDIGAQYLSSKRAQPADLSNRCALRVPSSTLLDARYAWSDRVWTVAVSGTNLADKKGYSYDFSCDASAVYPYAGRSLKLAISRQF